MTPTKNEVKLLAEWLEKNPGFIKAATITEWLGYDKREIRTLAEHSNGEIISWPGSPGYCHIRHATLDQIDHAINALQSQSDRMNKRAADIWKAYNAQGISA
jgi:hypothetical protein